MSQPSTDIAELQKELAALPPDTKQRDRAVLECRIAIAQMNRHDFDAAEVSFTTAIARLDPGHDAELLGNANTDLGRCYYAQARYHEAHARFSQALDHMRAAGSDESIGHCLHNLGNTLFMLDDLEDSLERYHEARQRFLDAGLVEKAAAPLSGMAKVHHNLGNYEEAVSLGLEGLEAHRVSGFPRGQADASIALARVHATMGDHETAMQYFDRCLDLYQGLKEQRLTAITRVGRAASLIHLGRLEEALPEFMTARESYLPDVDNELFVDVTSDIVYVLVELNQLDAAQREVDRMDAVPVQRATSTTKREFMRSRLLLARGDRDGATASTERAWEIAESSGDQSLILNILGQRRELARGAGDLETYVQLNDQYMEVSERMKGARVQRSVQARAKQHELTKQTVAAEQYRGLLYSTLPKDIADRIIRGEDVSGDHIDNAAVLFLDIAGFTTASSRYSPAEVTSLLARIFGAFDTLCAQHHVTKIKTIGDSYMAVAFADALGAESAEQRAANVALDMLESDFSWPASNELRATSSNRVQFRVGLHSGPVVAGVIGTERLQYDVWGDTVNTASRMESTGEPGRIQVSSEFHELLSGQAASNCRTVIRGTVDVKGKGVMTTYWLERV